MALEKYDPRKTSKTKKIIFTVILVFLTPYTLLLSLLFIEWVWTGRKPFSGKSGKLRKVGMVDKDEQESIQETD